ncbi:4-hydroxythreonine-4-phosphate dehydrogenase PdxA [Niabella insulamsoli]|uniref:4-hydroxythreonine-4-phosphate dehydrogenase PdxA n=1 Tax=Niabella insulamsoli TaxID=3144874 RepID=UPI0031FE191A
MNKPAIGITCGDINGIGLELIVKVFSDPRMNEICTPVLFASNKTVNFYRKLAGDNHFSFNAIKDFSRLSNKQLNLFSSWEEEVAVTPGKLNEIGGKYAVLSLQSAVKALQEGSIEGLVTAPIHKSNVQGPDFSYTGHTPFLKHTFQAKEVVMMMCAENMRVAVATEHIPVKEIHSHLSTELILKKIEIIHQSLSFDFGISKPRIAVLGLNPHAGDDDLVGDEESTVISPAIREAKNRNQLVFGPFSADAFFARGQYAHFDAVLAMYHDQGLIPFKSLAQGEGINYTAGLHIVRTSPDHGVAFDIAGKGIAQPHSFLEAVYKCVDILRNRSEYEAQRANPMKKMMPEVTSKLVDEKIED